jgi:hypothetical protein
LSVDVVSDVYMTPVMFRPGRYSARSRWRATRACSVIDLLVGMTMVTPGVGIPAPAVHGFLRAAGLGATRPFRLRGVARYVGSSLPVRTIAPPEPTCGPRLPVLCELRLSAAWANVVSMRWATGLLEAY